MKRKPSRRLFRKRYVLIDFGREISFDELKQFCRQYTDIFNRENGGPVVVYDRHKDKEVPLKALFPISAEGRYGIALVPHQIIDSVRPFLWRHGIKTLRTSGTVKKLRKEIEARSEGHE